MRLPLCLCIFERLVKTECKIRIDVYLSVCIPAVLIKCKLISLRRLCSTDSTVITSTLSLQGVLLLLTLLGLLLLSLLLLLLLSTLATLPNILSTTLAISHCFRILRLRVRSTSTLALVMPELPTIPTCTLWITRGLIGSIIPGK